MLHTLDLRGVGKELNRIKVAQILSIFNIMFLVLVFVFSYMGTFFIEDFYEYVAALADDYNADNPDVEIGFPGA